MTTVANVKKVSLLFFLALTGTHLFSSLMLSRGYLQTPMTWVNQSFDLPALLAGVLYAFTSFKLYLEELGKSSQWFDLVGGIIAAAVVMAGIVLNFFLK